MPTCENCGKALGSKKFCRACGKPAAPARRITIDEARFESLTDAILASYSTKQPRKRWRKILRNNAAVWFILSGCLAVAFVIGLLLGRAWQVQPPDAETLADVPAIPTALPQTVSQTPVPKTPVPRTPAPTASPSPTAAPTPTPTAAPTPTAKPTPKATPHSKLAPLTARGAVDVVKSNGELNVGGVGSCEGNDVTIAVGDYPRGCTIFRGTVAGVLADGVGTALMVPVSTSGSLDDVDYDLLYVRAPDFPQPRFIGILNGDGSGHLSVRLENGFIVEQNGYTVKYSKFDGSRLVSVSGPDATP